MLILYGETAPIRILREGIRMGTRRITDIPGCGRCCLGRVIFPETGEGNGGREKSGLSKLNVGSGAVVRELVSRVPVAHQL